MSAPGTPGPWRTEIDNVFAGPDGNSIYVADCAPMGGPVDGNPIPIANANLIAAAPDLYEALDTLFSDPLFQVAIGGNPNMVEALMARCNAALAKARGEA